MSDLAQFIRDRYDEADKLAREAEEYDGKVNHRYDAPDGEFLGAIRLGLFHDQNRPERRRADIRLKRGILVEHLLVGGNCRMCIEWPPKPGWCFTVRQLGTEFDQHPAYEQEWRPE